MKVIDFYSLPRSGQDRLLDSCRGLFAPKPLAVAKSIRPTAMLWAAAAIAAGVTLIVAWVVGFGQLGHGLARHPVALVVLFALLGLLVGLGIVQALAYRTRIASLTLPPGVYLFPANVVDAREAKIRVHALQEATAIAARGGRLVVAFKGAQFGFPVAKAQLAETVAAVERAKGELAQGLDEAALRERDPLVPLAIPSPLASTVPLTRTLPGWLRLRFAVPVVLALIGAGLFFLRDGASDDALFAAAKAKDDIPAYRTYLSQGDAHRSEVTSTLLPRAELKIAIAEGTVEAIDALRKAHPEAKITDEIEAARRAALDKHFATVVAKSTLNALMGFEASYPGHHLKDSVAKAKHALYAKSLSGFKAQLPEGSGAIGSFVERLVAQVEKTGPRKTKTGFSGPPTTVRIRRKASKVLENADVVVRKNPYYVGEPSLPTRYLSDPHLRGHEEKAAAAIAAALGKGFNQEIATFVAGPRLEGAVPKKVEAPTLFVSYRVEPSGSAYASAKPRGIYMGLVFFFELSFRLPEGDPLVTKYVVKIGVPIKTLRAQKPPFKPGKVEALLYDAMVTAGFAKLQKRYLAKWYP